jgi:hypothetical protein
MWGGRACGDCGAEELKFTELIELGMGNCSLSQLRPRFVDRSMSTRCLLESGKTTVPTSNSSGSLGFTLR